LQFGADVNVQAHCGCTPLTLAACSGDIGITQALLKSGADANKVCSSGKTALIVALEHGYHAIARLLKTAMAHSKQVKSERLASDIQTRERFAVFSATK